MASRFSLFLAELKRRKLIFGVLAAVSAWACADLDVVNPNAPDRGQALAQLEDPVSLVSGSFQTWFQGVYAYGGPGLFLSGASFQNTPPWSCSGDVFWRIPRIAINNDPDDPYYSRFARLWYYSYRTIADISLGLVALQELGSGAGTGTGNPPMVQSFARFVLGLSHATLAAFYDQGFKVDEATDLTQPQDPLDYRALMEEALGYFDEAISIAGSVDFTLPFEWMQAEVTSQDLVRIARSYKARFRAQVARTPAERAEVNWNAVIADAEAGIQSDFTISMDWNTGWHNETLDYATTTTWNQLSYFVFGMADQSGNIQEWLAMDLWDKSYQFPDGRPVLIETPDLRFPQGTTIEEQRAVSGRYFRIMSANEEGNTWKRPDRGPWRWSWYKAGPRGQEYWLNDAFNQPEITLAEMRLLKAEGLYRHGDLAGALAIINETRTAAGLNSTDASGTNTSCVPKLPDGSCGDLWEMLKWEKRMEVVWTGVAGANWWFDGRGWGDLWKDSPLHFPVPCLELQTLNMLPCNTYGGPGGEMRSEGSTYKYPGEGGVGAWLGAAAGSPLSRAGITSFGSCPASQAGSSY